MLPDQPTTRFECPDCGVRGPECLPSRLGRVRVSHVCGQTCPACGWRKQTQGARGLCWTCHRDPAVRVDYEPKVRPADDLLDTWDELRREGYSISLAAERIGITRKALDKAINRAKHRGDPRAVRPPHPSTNKRYMDRGAA